MTAKATEKVPRETLRRAFTQAKETGKPLYVTFVPDGIAEVRYLSLMLKQNTIFCEDRHLLEAVAASGTWDNVGRTFVLTIRPYADEDWFVGRLLKGLEKAEVGA